MLKGEELLKLFETAGAIRHGHFELSSGLHSGTYVQCALVLQYPRFAEKLGQALAALFSDARIDAVVSPAIGGLIIGQEVARALPEQKHSPGGGTPALFVERDASGMMTLRRGFSLAPEQHVLVVEDVWTTGGSNCGFDSSTRTRRSPRATLVAVKSPAADAPTTMTSRSLCAGRG